VAGSKQNGSEFNSEFESETRNSLGERLRLIWKDSGLSQDDFSSRIGIT